MSVREAAHLVHVAKDTANDSFHELEAKGFIRRHVCGSFNWQLRHATTWILTEHSFLDKDATKEFARWVAENSEAGPKGMPSCPKRGKETGRSRLILSFDRTGLGPWSPSCTATRPQTTAHI